MEPDRRSGPFPFRILFVDDDPALAGLYSDLLQSQGYEVYVARSGFEALADLRQSLPDLVVSDLNMPGMSGLELLAIIRRRFPSLPLLAISGGDDIGSLALNADAACARSGDKQTIFELCARLVRTGVRRRVIRRARLPWVARRGATMPRVTCAECLRSFRLPAGSIDAGTRPGVHSCECVYCGSNVNFIVGDTAEAA